MQTVKDKCPYLEMFGAEGLQPGSFYKLHLPFDAARFNPNAKYVLVTRNPRDVAVSYYHFTNMIPPGIPGESQRRSFPKHPMNRESDLSVQRKQSKAVEIPLLGFIRIFHYIAQVLRT